MRPRESKIQRRRCAKPCSCGTGQTPPSPSVTSRQSLLTLEHAWHQFSDPRHRSGHRSTSSSGYKKMRISSYHIALYHTHQSNHRPTTVEPRPTTVTMRPNSLVYVCVHMRVRPCTCTCTCAHGMHIHAHATCACACTCCACACVPCDHHATTLSLSLSTTTT